MPLITTVGGATSNSYVSRTEADTYFAQHWSTARNDLWTTLNPAQKDRVLTHAANVLESLRFLDSEHTYGVALPLSLREGGEYDYTIHRLTSGQKLQFPRNVDVDDDEVAFIPQEVKDAQCEQAVYLLSFDESNLSTQLQGVMEEAVGASGVRSYIQYSRRGSFVSPLALQLVAPFLRRGNRLKRA